ncbi:MAG: Mth938-like domain-containing protein [Pseudomonadota bacterium]
MAFEEIAGPAGSPRITAVRGGRFVVGDEAQEGGFLIWPDGVTPVTARTVDQLGESDFAPLSGLDIPRDVVLIGSGATMAWPDTALLKHLRDEGLGPEVMDSRAAARTYNLLLAEERAVAALILPLE